MPSILLRSRPKDQVCLWTKLRDAQCKTVLCMQVIIERLEGESVEARQTAQEQAEARQAALKTQYQKALHAAQESHRKQSER